MEFLGTPNSEPLQGTDGADTLRGLGGADTLSGLGGNDSILGGEGNDILLGNNFDSITAGSDTLEGGEGDDAYLVGLETGGGSLIRDTQGNANVLIVIADNTDLNVFGSLDTTNLADSVSVIENQETWGDSFIEISRPQAGIVGLEKSGTSLIVDINRDGVAEAASDLTIADYFDEQGNIGAGAPIIFNNIVGESQQNVVNLFAENPPAPGNTNPNLDPDPIVGTDGDDSLEGTANNDIVEGRGGNDMLNGSGGNDTIFGGAGNDSLSGGGLGAAFFTVGGSDFLAGGAGNDAYILVQDTAGGSTIQDEQGDTNTITVVAANTDINAIVNLVDLDPTNPEQTQAGLDVIADPNTYGDSAIALSAPQAGIVGLARSGTDLIVDINRDGIGEAQNDLTIVNYFDEQGNLGLGAPAILNNIIDQQEVINFFSNNSDVGEGNGSFGTTVYRFLNNDLGVHFYTANETERDSVSGLDNFSFEGASYSAVDPLTGGGVPVYRFLNQDTGVHLYTVSEIERESVANLANFSFEGEAFFAYATEIDGSIPIYRFFNNNTGAHFYTPSAEERDNVESSLPDFQSEGIAYYALPSVTINNEIFA